MSLSGNINYSTPNLQNEYPLAELEEDVATNTQNIFNIQAEQITQNTDISNNTTNISNMQTEQITQNTNISNNTTNISNMQTEQTTQNTRLTATETTANNANTNANTVLGRTTGMSYFAPNDTTYIFNRLFVSSPIDSLAVNPQITLIDDSPTNGNVNLSILCGANLGNWNNLVQNNDGLFLLRKNDASMSYTGGMVFTTHGGNGGFRFSYNPAVPSVFRSNINLETYQLTTTGNISAGTITLLGVDLTTTLNNLKNKLLAVSYIVVPAVPGFFPSFDTYEIEADNININGIVKINGNNINSQISSLQAEQITQNTNISTNASNIINWVNNIDANEYNLSNVNSLTAQSVTSNTVVTNTLDVPSLNGLTNSFITTSNNRATTITSETSIGNASSIILSTHNTTGNVNLLTINNSTVDFGGRQLNNYIPSFPTMRSFSVKVTYDGSAFVLYNNPIFDSYLVNYVAPLNTPITTIQQGNFKIYIRKSFYGGNGAVMVDDLHVSVNGLFRTDGDANHTILCGAPQKFLDTVGCELEFFFSRTNAPSSGSWLDSTGYINIMFSIPFV